MYELVTKEKQIIFQLKTKAPEIKFAFDKLLERFADDDEKNFTKHCPLIRTIYFEESTVPKWKLAVQFDISDRSVYRYRKRYLEWIDFYTKKYRRLNSSGVV